MKQQSDTVQKTATAYAEREVLEACCRALPQVHPAGLLGAADLVLSSEEAMACKGCTSSWLYHCSKMHGQALP